MKTTKALFAAAAVVASRRPFSHDVLCGRPILGRGFLQGEDAPGTEPVAVDHPYHPPCGSYRGNAVPGFRRSLWTADLQISIGTLALRTPSRASARHFIQGAA